MALVVGPELFVVGIGCLIAGWTYTGGPRPYGYAGLGEVFVFVFFGLVATIGTNYVLSEQLSGLAASTSVVVGLWATALLVINNLRDIPSDEAAGKMTLAVRLGDARTRHLFCGHSGRGDVDRRGDHRADGALRGGRSGGSSVCGSRHWIGSSESDGVGTHRGVGRHRSSATHCWVGHGTRDRPIRLSPEGLGGSLLEFNLMASTDRPTFRSGPQVSGNAYGKYRNPDGYGETHHREHQSACLLGDFKRDGSAEVFDFTPYLGELAIHLAIDLGEPAIHLAIDPGELAIDLGEPAIEFGDQAFLKGLQVILWWLVGPIALGVVTP